jgi:hypothetical protein
VPADRVTGVPDDEQPDGSTPAVAAIIPAPASALFT